MKEAPHFEIDFSGEFKPEIVHEEPTFEKKINVISAQYEEFLFMEQHGKDPEGENVDDSFVPRRKKQLEAEYISLVCECSHEENEKLKVHTLGRLMYGILQALKEERESEKERDKFEIERYDSVFVLYMTGQAERDAKQKKN